MDFKDIKKLCELYASSAEKPKEGDKIDVQIVSVSSFDDSDCFTIKLGAPFNATRKIHFIKE